MTFPTGWLDPTKWTRKRILGITAGFLVFIFLLSLILFFLNEDRLSRATLLFPHQITKAISPETRFLPFDSDPEKKIRLLAEEVLLGPADNSHLRLFPRGARVRSVLFRGDKAYLDLSPEVIFFDPEVLIGTRGATEVLRMTLITNFRELSDVIVTVAGQEIPSSESEKAVPEKETAGDKSE